MQLILLNVRYHKIVFNLRFYGEKKKRQQQQKLVITSPKLKLEILFLSSFLK